MTLSCISKWLASSFKIQNTQTRSRTALVIPAAYNSANGGKVGNSTSLLSFLDERDPQVDPGNQAALLVISRGTSIMLLAVYSVYLYFQACSDVLFRDAGLYAHHIFERSWRRIIICSKQPRTRKRKNPIWVLLPLLQRLFPSVKVYMDLTDKASTDYF